MMYYYGGMFPGHMFGFVFMIIFWLFIALVAISIFKKINRSTHSDDSISILKERYARGEITKEQFHDMKKDLEHTK